MVTRERLVNGIAEVGMLRARRRRTMAPPRNERALGAILRGEAALAFSSLGLYSFCTVLKRDEWLE